MTNNAYCVAFTNKNSLGVNDTTEPYAQRAVVAATMDAALTKFKVAFPHAAITSIGLIAPVVE